MLHLDLIKKQKHAFAKAGTNDVASKLMCLNNSPPLNLGVSSIWRFGVSSSWERLHAPETNFLLHSGNKSSICAAGRFRPGFIPVKQSQLYQIQFVISKLKYVTCLWSAVSIWLLLASSANTVGTTAWVSPLLSVKLLLANSYLSCLYGQILLHESHEYYDHRYPLRHNCWLHHGYPDALMLLTPPFVGEPPCPNNDCFSDQERRPSCLHLLRDAKVWGQQKHGNSKRGDYNLGDLPSNHHQLPWETWEQTSISSWTILRLNIAGWKRWPFPTGDTYVRLPKA